MGRYIDRRCLALILCLASALATAQTTNKPSPSAQDPSAQDPSAQDPPIPQLLLDVDRNQKAAEAATNDYTYHVHLELQDLDHNGNIKKTAITDSESITIDGVRIDRVVARNGKPLTADEAQKESDHIDKEIAHAKARRAKLANKGQPTDPRGDPIIPASRILELGAFTNPRRVDLDGRPTIVLDYAGDPNAKTHNESEGIIRDLVGTVWIDEQDRVLVRAQGHFLRDFKIGAGLVLNIHKGLTFDFRATRVNDVWLPATIDGQGSARILLVDTVNGRFRLVTSDYRKFRTRTTILQTGRIIGPDGQPIPNQTPDRSTPTPQPTPPQPTPIRPTPQRQP